MIRPTLKHKPSDYFYHDLLAKFADGKPLSCDQQNFLFRHQRTLSSHGLDSLMQYYRVHHDDSNFLLPHQRLKANDIAILKRRLDMLLEEKNSHTTFNMKPEQFLQMRAMTVDELILYHGNQFMTGAPFHPGGIPYTLLFQWGNLFGVAKYVVLAEEKSIQGNVLMYFENRHERLLDECVKQYQLTHQVDLALQKTANETHRLEADFVPQSPYQLPKLSLTGSKGAKEVEAK